ncbi:MAG TPA: RNA polymerase sigma factor [Solirubrobacteraceae bacterium]|nr:RNA polymerase sigma factor [Solirubrobacteraceae bacterium]
MKSHQRQRRTSSDAELLRSARRDPSAFSELYTRHVGDVHAWLSRRIAWAANDLTAETFARALLSIDRFSDDREGTALPWLLGIARHVLLETVRQDRIETRARERLGLPLDLAVDDGFSEVEERLSPRRALERQLDALPPGEREALKLRVVDELPYDELAGRLDIRPAAARLRVSRALRRLAHTVPQEET